MPDQASHLASPLSPPSGAPAPARSPRQTNPRRVAWLDGIRGASALFVVVHHTWLQVWPAYPRDTGPWWLGWLLYGHLAVAVFIVVSGFSLSLAPVRHGDTLSGGTRRFLRRRAWRILPPYWAALTISTVVAWLLLSPGASTGAVIHGFVIHWVLLQDITGSWVPNTTFWSIAVEWQIYFAFPLVLWLARRTGIRTATLCTVALVVAAEGVSAAGSPFDKINHLTPQFLALFAMGALAAHLGDDTLKPRPRRRLALAGGCALGAVIIAALVNGSVWMVDHYFWVDLVFGCAVACLIAIMHGGGAARTRRAMASRPALKIGLFSYSIYLLHAPLLEAADVKLVQPLHLAPLAAFGLLVAVAIPVIVALCYGFHLVFEAPFLQRRGLDALRVIPIPGKLRRRRRSALAALPITRVIDSDATPSR